MQYSKQELELIYKMKRVIINEFRYLYDDHDDIFVPLAFLGEPDLSIDIIDLQDAFKMGMSNEDKVIIRKYNFLDLFNQALVELFEEEIIEFEDSETIVVTDKGENMFIIPDK